MLFKCLFQQFIYFYTLSATDSISHTTNTGTAATVHEMKHIKQTLNIGTSFLHSILFFGLLGELLHLSALRSLGIVPAVLDLILGATRKKLGDIDPLVAQTSLCLEQNGIFLVSPRRLLQGRIEFGSETIANVLRKSSPEDSGNLRPRLSRCHLLLDDGILLVCPRSALEARLQYLQPTVFALSRRRGQTIKYD